MFINPDDSALTEKLAQGKEWQAWKVTAQNSAVVMDRAAIDCCLNCSRVDGSKSSRRCGQVGHRLPPTSIQFQGETLAIG
ncbi:MAG: hypothetical protein HQL77_18850 [Magnetococcales bacterium]|nr:hypothetical protein [Magnetococcales bacterium]